MRQYAPVLAYRRRKTDSLAVSVPIQRTTAGRREEGVSASARSRGGEEKWGRTSVDGEDQRSEPK